MVASSPVGRNGQRARLFRVYNYYRIAVSLLLVSLLLLETDLLGAAMNEELLFQGTALAYLAINILTGLLLLAGYPFAPGTSPFPYWRTSFSCTCWPCPAAVLVPASSTWSSSALQPATY